MSQCCDCFVISGPFTPPEENRSLRLLIDHLPALIGYWDRDLRNVIANNAYGEYFGLTPAEVQGRHISEVLGESVYELNLPHIEGALAGEVQLFDRTLIDQHGVDRYTQASYIPDIVDGEVQGFYVLVTDVSARVEAERARDEAQRLWEISMENAPFGKALFSASGNVLFVNPALCGRLGYTGDELTGEGFHRHVHPDHLAAARADWASLIDGSAGRTASEYRYLCRDGTTVWMQCHAVLVPGAFGSKDIVVAQFQDMTERRHFEAELSRLALTEPLTGLANRGALTKFLSEHLAGDPNTPVGVIFIDLDGFKQINDVHGHAAGDAVLIQAARRIEGDVVPPNSVYRVGGDEFVILVIDAETATRVRQLADQVRTGLARSYDAAGVQVSLTASVGWSRGDASDGVESLIDKADADMYRRKKAAGRRKAQRINSSRGT